jgi:hypothetical protein
MKTSFREIDTIFDFKGLWDIPSKCGLKIIRKDNQYRVIVSELYQDNPGTSITQATALLAKQICDAYTIPLSDMIYIEHNPNMNSKLSFYDEVFYHVKFDIQDNRFLNPQWKQLTEEEVKEYSKA